MPSALTQFTDFHVPTQEAGTWLLDVADAPLPLLPPPPPPQAASIALIMTAADNASH
ncbi:MAG: hypothetical protein KGR99_17230 [Betaproteobacteria bacterium]|nr:hypothetical protein [Betaproteobacteria bacterium]MDE2154225.1 hypothetical protein [Betaproteobacteria bacterium]